MQAASTWACTQYMVHESFAMSMRVLWVWTTVLFPSPDFLSLFGSRIKQDRRVDRREALVDSAKC